MNISAIVIEKLIERLREPDYEHYGCELSRCEAELAIFALEKMLEETFGFILD